jgi:hypothetical protein
MMQDEYFLTEIVSKKDKIARTTSAGSIRTTNATMDFKSKE